MLALLPFGRGLPFFHQYDVVHVSMVRFDP